MGTAPWRMHHASPQTFPDQTPLFLEASKSRIRNFASVCQSPSEGQLSAPSKTRHKMTQKFKSVPVQNEFSTASLPSSRSSTQGPTKLDTSPSDGKRTASSTSSNSGQNYAGCDSAPLQMELFTEPKAWYISMYILRTVNNSVGAQQHSRALLLCVCVCACDVCFAESFLRLGTHFANH